MIRKLRRRFVLISMALVVLVLIGLFSAICVSSYRSLREDSLDAMHRALVEFRYRLRIGDDVVNRRSVFTTEDDNEAHIAVSCIWIDAEEGYSNVVYFIEDDSLTRDDVLFAAGTVSQIEDVDEGILYRMNLRWKRESAEGGTVYAFVDRSTEIAIMSDLVRNTGLICVAAAVIFWLISMYLVRLMAKPVEEAWEQQRQFIADASHELKTPLTVVLANIGIVRAHPNETIHSQDKWLRYISEETERMRQLVEDMLFLARSDASRDRVLPVRFDASESVMNCLLSLESIAFEKGIMIDSEIDPDIFLEGDPNQFRQLCMILLDNARKYADQNGTVTVTLSRMLDRVRLSVYNSGKPIPKESVPHLFERFYRADSSRTRDEGGYGLGLSIAEKIVKNFRGRIVVEPDETGNTFFVYFPTKELKSSDR